MNSCRDMRVLLLEADLDELAGDGSSPVAEHVRACAGCRDIAGRIVEETRGLDSYLSRGASAPDVDAILGAVGVGDAATDPPPRVLPFTPWRRWTALAAAAAVAGLFFLRADDAPQVVGPVAFQTPPLVEAAPDRNVAVMPTANPDITVLWFF